MCAAWVIASSWAHPLQQSRVLFHLRYSSKEFVFNTGVCVSFHLFRFCTNMEGAELCHWHSSNTSFRCAKFWSCFVSSSNRTINVLIYGLLIWPMFLVCCRVLCVINYLMARKATCRKTHLIIISLVLIPCTVHCWTPCCCTQMLLLFNVFWCVVCVELGTRIFDSYLLDCMLLLLILKLSHCGVLTTSCYPAKEG